MEKLTETYCPTCQKNVSNVLFEYVDDPQEGNLTEIRIACEIDNATLMVM